MRHKILYFGYIFGVIFLIIKVTEWNWIEMLAMSIDWIMVLISIILLLFGFLINILGWYRSLLTCEKDVTFSEAFISIGLSIFLKYIPGKVWILLGRAEWISIKHDLSRTKAVQLSTMNQVLVLFSGLLVGTLVFFKLGLDSDLYHLIIPYLLAVFLLGVIIFARIESIVSKISSRFGFSLNVAITSYGHKLELMLIYLCNWIIWGVSFTVLLWSIDLNVNILEGSIFALSTCAGIVAVFAPGGIGVREFVIGLLLTEHGVQEELAISISILSRVWFLFAEIILFLSAFILSRYNIR